MKDSELQFDRTCHVLYSKACRHQILSKIALHYPTAQCEEIWTRVQRQFVDFLSDWRTDLGGKKNFHNGKGGTYDCIALMAYYVVCREATSLAEIEEMEGALFLPSFRKLRFVNCNKAVFNMISGSGGDFSGVGDIHFFYSADEVLYGALPDFEAACRHVDVRYTAYARPGMVHCYCMLPYFKEARAGFAKIVGILKQ